MGKREREADLRRYGRWLVAVVGGMLAFVALTSLAQRAATVRRLSAEVDAVSTRYAQVSATQSYLQTQVVRATQGIGFDEALREEAGMARPGDEVIVPVPVGTPDPTATPSRTASDNAATLPPPPWEVWWQLFFAPLH